MNTKMNWQQMKLIGAVLFLTVSGTFLAYGQNADVQDASSATEQLLTETKERLKDNQQAQRQVDDVFDQTKQLEQDFQQELKLMDGINLYNAMMQKQLDKQQQHMDTIRESIANASLIERQIMPLLVRMVSALDDLLKVDLPFLLEERQERIAKLAELLERPDLTLAEKSRRVFEAYQIEMEYGYTIESYKGRLTVDDQEFAADFLRIGRMSLMYQDINGKKVGFWNKNNGAWEGLTESQYKRHIAKGLRIAKQEIAPELVTVPFNQTLEVR